MTSLESAVVAAHGVTAERVDLGDPDMLEAVLALCGKALGWDVREPNGAFFRWKHLENPFGQSPAWVARHDNRLIGVRLFLRWRAMQPDGRSLDLVRAVDTATAAGHQGRGIFSALTAAAVDELAREGVDAIFNTPNEKSRPGYLKMGWTEWGRVPVGAAPCSPRAAVALVKRGVSSKWGEPLEVGVDPSVALSDDASIEALLASAGRPTGLMTDRSARLLQWRFGLPALAYRVHLLGSTPGDGLIVFRVRSRSGLRELAISEVILPKGQRVSPRTWLTLARRCHADILTTSGRTRSLVTGLLPLPRRVGPMLTWRALTDAPVPSSGELAFGHGDLELF